MKPEDVPPPKLKPGEHIISREVTGPDEDNGWWLIEYLVVGFRPGESLCFHIHTLKCTSDNYVWRVDPTSSMCMSRPEYEQLRKLIMEN